MPKLTIIDGNSLLFRAYYATAYPGVEIMRNQDGIPTNAIFAFSNMMNKIVSSLKDGEGIIVAFDVTSKKSFNNVVKWLEQINEKTNKVAIVLFGNKCDMEKREVTKEEAENFAKEHHLPYFETSAKEKININEGFSKVANEAYAKYGNKEGIDLEDGKKPSGGCCGKEKEKEKRKKK